MTRLGSLAAADGRPAVIEPGRGSVSYADLDRLADGVAARLCRLGVEPGARIGLYVRRSCDAIAAMLGTLRAGCTYVPVDPGAPVERNAEIHTDCGVRLTIVEERFEAGYRQATRRLGGSIDVHPIASVGLGRAIREWAPDPAEFAPELRAKRASAQSGVACILYTSGTTGRHKGWMMSRAAIAAFARWSHRLFGIGERDVFANHAPFHFAMSLFDIYSSSTCGAPLVLVPDEVRQFARHVVDLISRERVTILFATPSILSRIAALDDLESRDLSALRLVVFGGEVFPAPQLTTLRRRLPHPRYFNCWGSTETNIATYYEIPRDAEFDGPPPIGRPSEHYEARVVGVQGEVVSAGTIGELQLRGEGLTTGYLNQPALNAERLLPAADGGLPWYRTGDLVVELPAGDLRYAGRIGRMVKLRGYRVEPGEIETRLYEHPAIKEAGVVAVDGSRGLELVAHVSGTRLSVVELKEFCAVKLPPYMIPERFVFHAALPRTSRGKIDFERLRRETPAQ
jgi:amino acid adenylation domain-containing protein